MEELSEREIIEKIHKGQIEYFSYFVKKYTPVVFYYVFTRVNNNTEDTNDIIQNSFIKVYKAIDKIDPERQFYPYFFQIVKNEIIEFFRRKKQHLPLLEDSLVQDVTAHEDTVDLQMLLNKLQKEHRGVLRMYYIEGYSYQDIADKLNKPLNTVKTLIRRAKMELRSKYAID